MAAPVKNMRTIFPSTVVADSTSTTTTTPTTTSLPSRTNAAISGGLLASMAAAASVQTSLTMAKTFSLLNVLATYPVRVRLYSTAAAQAADLARPYSVQIAPGSEHEMICDLYLTTGNLNWVMSPAAEGSNMDTALSATIYWTVTNLDTVTRSPSVTFTYLPLEA
jgi:hypothetical protein